MSSSLVDANRGGVNASTSLELNREAARCWSPL